MRFFLYFAFLCGSLPFVLRWPFFGLCLYSVISLMQPKVLCWHPDLPDSMMVGLPLVLGAAIFGVHRRCVQPARDFASGRVTEVREFVVRNRLFEWSGLMLVLMLLIAYIGLARILTGPPSVANVDAYSRLCKVALVTLLSTGLAPDLRRLRILYLVTALASAFWAIKGGIWVLFIGPHQVYGADYDNNLFALKSAMVLPMLYGLAQWQVRGRWRNALLAACALISLSIIGSGSRSGFLAFGFVMICLASTGKHRVKSLIAVGLVLTLAIALSWADIRTRLDSIYNYRTDSSALSRIVAWKSMLDLFAGSPIIGIGFGNSERPYDPTRPWSRAGHSIWLQNLAELGLIGHALWLALILGTMASLYRLMRRGAHGPPELRWCYHLGRGLLLGMGAFCIHGMFHNDEYLDLMFSFVALTVVLGAVHRREAAEMQLHTMLDAPQAGHTATRRADLPEPASLDLWPGVLAGRQA